MASLVASKTKYSIKVMFVQGIYIDASINSLSRMTKEVAIDTKFGTNNAGMDLFAELDGTGISITYLFVEKRALNGLMPAGTMREILDQFLRPFSNQC